MTHIWNTVGSFSVGEIAFDLDVQDGRVVSAKLVHLKKPCEHHLSDKVRVDVDSSKTVRETCRVCGSVFTYPWYEDKRQSAHQDPVFDPDAKVWIPSQSK